MYSPPLKTAPIDTFERLINHAYDTDLSTWFKNNLRLSLNSKGEWVNQKGELFRPDLNIDQALLLAQHLDLSVTMKFANMAPGVQYVICKYHQIEQTLELTDEPQTGATFARSDTTILRNAARAITFMSLQVLKELYSIAVV